MKILFLSAANSGHTVRWVNALAKKGHNVYLVSLPNHQEQENSISSNVTIHYLSVPNAKGYYLNAIEVHCLARKICPDIVNAHYASGYGTLMRVAKLENTVLSVWGSDVYDFPYQNKFCMNLIKKNLKYADKIASTSKCMAIQTEKIMGKQLDITITPFGVDLKKFSERRNNTSNHIVIGCVKALEQKYGIDTLIKAIYILFKNLECEKNLLDLANRIHCYIYGDGSQKQMLEDLIKELRLENRIFLMGKVPHEKVSSILDEIDIFCALSESESFGVAVVEAQAKGIPVVVSDVDGFREVVHDGVTGIIVPRKSEKKAAEALKKLIFDDALRIKMGSAGRERVEQLYDWEENVNTMERLYAKLLID